VLPSAQAPPAEQQTLDRGHLLSRTGSAAAEGSAAPSIASTPRHSTAHRLQEGAAVERAQSDPPSEAQLRGVGSGDGALASQPAPEQPDLRAYVDRKLANVNRILNGGEHIANAVRRLVQLLGHSDSLIDRPRAIGRTRG